MSRAKRSAINFGSSSVVSLVSLVAAFVSTPYVLRGLGAERLGLFRTATEWAGYLGLLEIGLTGALGPLLAQAAALKKPEAVGETFSLGLRAYIPIAALTLVLGCILWAALPALVQAPQELQNELQIGFAFVVVATVFVPLNAYRALAEAIQKQYLVSLFVCIQVLGTAIGCSIAALWGWGLPGQFGIATFGTLIVPLGLLLVFGRTKLPSALVAGEAASGYPERLSNLSRSTFQFHLMGRLCLFTDNIVLGAFLGPSVVASYFLTTRIVQISAGQLQAVGSATWAALAEIYHTGQHDIFRKRLIQLTRLTAMLSAAVTVPLAVLTLPFVTLWVGQSHYAGNIVVAIAVVNSALLPIFSLWGWVFSGQGRIELTLPFVIGEAVLNVCLSVFATLWLGIAGPLVGTAFVNIFYNPVWTTRLLRREFDIPIEQLILAVVVPFIPTVLILGGLTASYSLWPAPSWQRLACEYGIAIGCYCILAWFWLLQESERMTLCAVARGAFTRGYHYLAQVEVGRNF